MRTHLFSTAITSKAAVTAAAVILIGGGAALADTADLQDEEIEEPADTEDEDGDAYALGRADREGEDVEETQEQRIQRFCDDENPDAPFCEDAVSAPGTGPEEEPVDPEEEVEAEGEGERSETAMRVHEALTAGEAEPGDDDFGQIVSERAQGGGLGKDVSSAARGGEDPDDAGTADEDEVSTSDDEEVEIEPAEASGPPDHAKGKARGRG